MKNTYYFYSGFNKPKTIEVSDVVITSNYLGDLTESFLEEHQEWEKESDLEYNEHMHHHFNVLRNVTLKELQEINRVYGLSDNDYLDDFLSKRLKA